MSKPCRENNDTCFLLTDVSEALSAALVESAAADVDVGMSESEAIEELSEGAALEVASASVRLSDAESWPKTEFVAARTSAEMAKTFFMA